MFKSYIVNDKRDAVQSFIMQNTATYKHTHTYKRTHTHTKKTHSRSARAQNQI